MCIRDRCLCEIVAGVNREFNLHVLVGHADTCRAQRALGDNGCRVSQTRHADLLALEVGNALDVAVTGDEQLDAAGVDAGGELDGQAVFQRLEQLADQTHADIDLIRADGLGNVCRVNRYLLNVQTFVLEAVSYTHLDGGALQKILRPVFVAPFCNTAYYCKGSPRQDASFSQITLAE